MNHRYLLALPFLLLAACATGQQSTDSPQPDTLAAHIRFLAADEMQGRGTGSPELRRAGAYIAAQFKRYRLKPLGTDGYYQPFTVASERRKVKNGVQARNVIGFLDNDASYTIIIGAHYDHLGEGDQGGSKDPDPEGKIHNGADDNASGVAGLLELARCFSGGAEKERYNLLFIAFSAEELGLLGSKYFTAHPTLSLDSVHFMLNMDMIGRYNPERGVGIGGFGTSPSWPEIFEGVQTDINFFTDPAGSGGSDHGSFFAMELPVLFFHTGGHPDYHRPGDDPEKVDVISEAAILELGIQLIENAMKVPKLEFSKP